jgi:hypothetical protein
MTKSIDLVSCLPAEAQQFSFELRKARSSAWDVQPFKATPSACIPNASTPCSAMHSKQPRSAFR